MSKSRRSNILINPRFQLRYSLFVCTWIFTLSAVFPMILMRLFEFFGVVTQAHCRPDAAQVLEVVRSDTFSLLMSFLAVFVLVVILTSLFMSHRIAGPLYKLGLAMDRVIGGDFGSALEFRKHDHFQETAAHFNRMMGSVRSALVGSRDSLKSAISRIENAMEHADEEGRTQLKGALDELRRLEGSPRSE